MDKKTIRFCAVMILFAIGLRLHAGGFFHQCLDVLTGPKVRAFLLYAGTGMVYVPPEQTTVPPETVPEETQPLPSFSPDDATLLHNTIGAMFWCGSNLTCSNMQLSCSPDATRPTHIALFSCVTSMAGGMLGSLAGGALLEAWHSSGMFTGAFDRYQALFVLSVINRVTSSLLLGACFAPDNEARPRDMLRYMARAVLAPLQRRQAK